MHSLYLYIYIVNYHIGNAIYKKLRKIPKYTVHRGVLTFETQ